jgi:hypothetical protein
MSKRNFILLIIVLIIIVLAIFGFLYWNKPATNNTTGNTPSTNFFSQFNPFASNKNTNPTPTPEPTPTPNPNPTIEEINIKLKKVSSMPVAGFTVFSKERLVAVPVVESNPTQTFPLSGEGNTAAVVPPVKGGAGGLKKVSTKVVTPKTEFVPALRYVARATGNIYETFADTIAENQFSSTVIPKVYDAYFGNKGQSVAMRYLDTDGKTIETFLGVLPKESLSANPSTINQITGSLLPKNIEDISISPDSSNMFYLFDSGNDLIGTTLNFLNNKKIQIFDSPFTEWLSGWPNSKTITLTTKPSSTVPGYMYEINSADGKNFNQVWGEVNGLTTLTSPDGKLVLYGDGNLNLSVYNISTNTSTLLGVKTLPEKCVWGSASDAVYCAVPKSIPAGQYPDAWYQGEVSFSDQIWRVAIKTGNSTMLVDPLTISGGEDVDGIKLALDPSANYLFFVNKKDSYLWEFNLK